MCFLWLTAGQGAGREGRSSKANDKISIFVCEYKYTAMREADSLVLSVP